MGKGVNAAKRSRTRTPTARSITHAVTVCATLRATRSVTWTHAATRAGARVAARWMISTTTRVTVTPKTSERWQSRCTGTRLRTARYPLAVRVTETHTDLQTATWTHTRIIAFTISLWPDDTFSSDRVLSVWMISCTQKRFNWKLRNWNETKALWENIHFYLCNVMSITTNEIMGRTFFLLVWLQYSFFSHQWFGSRFIYLRAFPLPAPLTATPFCSPFKKWLIARCSTKFITASDSPLCHIGLNH